MYLYTALGCIRNNNLQLNLCQYLDLAMYDGAHKGQEVVETNEKVLTQLLEGGKVRQKH